MSRHALESVRHSDALQQTVGYEQLEAYHVPFDELTGTTAVEAELTHWSTRQGRVAVIGPPSGSGKSSVMAAVLGQLAEAVPDRLCPVRIPVELAEHEVIADRRSAHADRDTQTRGTARCHSANPPATPRRPRPRVLGR